MNVLTIINNNINEFIIQLTYIFKGIPLGTLLLNKNIKYLSL